MNTDLFLLFGQPGRTMTSCAYSKIVLSILHEVEDVDHRSPQGILGEDGYCFDLDEFDETLLCYLEKRMDEAYNSALPAHL